MSQTALANERHVNFTGYFVKRFRAVVFLDDEKSYKDTMVGMSGNRNCSFPPPFVFVSFFIVMHDFSLS